MRIASVVVAIALLLLVGGCSDGIVTGDGGFNLVESLRVASIAPPTSTSSGYTEVVLRCNNRYAGRGKIMFSGSCGSNSIGILHSPIQGEVGTLMAPIELPAGDFDIVALIEVNCDIARCALDATVTCDSLYVEGAVVAWDSAEGLTLYRQDIPDNTAFLFNQTWVAADLACPAQ